MPRDSASRQRLSKLRTNPREIAGLDLTFLSQNLTQKMAGWTGLEPTFRLEAKSLENADLVED
jgi:hypothetical protein